MFDRHSILKAHYRAKIESWDWEGIVADCQETGGTYLGSCLSLAPSGKYYTFWTSNQTRKDETKDEAFYEVLDEVAEAHGGWIESGEGDPCDICFVVRSSEEDEVS